MSYWRVPLSLLLPRLVLLALSLLGWGLFLRGIIAMALTSIALEGQQLGGMGVDTYAYWLAGGNVLSGDPIYATTAIDELGAYLYPPPFAQAWAPLSVLPAVVAEWAWRLLGVLSIRYMAGSWFVTGLWWIYPGTIIELAAGNVTFQVAALTVAGLRGRAEGVFPAALVKFSAVAIVPFLWLRRSGTRRGLLLGGAIAAAIGLASVLLDVGAWRDYLGILGGQAGQTFENPTILHILPTPAADFLLRTAIALGIVVASVRFDSPHLAYLAAVLLTPTLWMQRLAVLFALLTLEGGRWLRPYQWPWKRAEISTGPESGSEAQVVAAN